MAAYVGSAVDDVVDIIGQLLTDLHNYKAYLKSCRLGGYYDARATTLAQDIADKAATLAKQDS